MLGAIGDGIDRHPQRDVERVAGVVSRDPCADRIVLDRSAEDALLVAPPRSVDGVLRGNGCLERGERRVDRGEVDAVAHRRHVLDARERDSLQADERRSPRMVVVEPALRGGVGNDREAALALGDQEAKPLVGRTRRLGAREVACDPHTGAVATRVLSASERKLPRVADLALVTAVHVRRPVELLQRHARSRGARLLLQAH